MNLAPATPTFFDWVEFFSWFATPAGLGFVWMQVRSGRAQTEMDTLFRLNDQQKTLAARMRELDEDAPDAEDRYDDLLRDALNLYEIYALGVLAGNFSKNAESFVVDFLTGELRGLLAVRQVRELIRSEKQIDPSRLENIHSFIRYYDLERPMPDPVAIASDLEALRDGL